MAIPKRQFIILICLSILLASCSANDPKKTAESPPKHKPPVAAIKKPARAAAPKPQPQATSDYDNIWQRIRAGYDLPEVSNSKINDKIRWYGKRQRYFNTFTDQAEPYLYYVVSQLQENNLPLEFTFIPIIESLYNPHVESPSNTAGIWQFIPGTAKNFGLKQNKWYNGRKDVIASTDAAIRYLKILSKDFDNDWLLVIAAYNAGEGTVKNAIEKNKRAGKPTDFWSLSLPRHTQDYIPHLIALSKIIADPQHYNIELKDIPDTPYFVTIDIDKQINLSQAAKQSSIDPDELKKLNSGINGWITPPAGSSLLVPIADAEEFSLQLNSLPKIAPAVMAAENKTQQQNAAQNKGQQSGYYTVKSGDSLSAIAKAKNTTVTKLAKLNNISSSSVLKPGQKLRTEN